MSEWKETKLGDLIKIKSGFSYKGEFIGKGDSFLLGMGCVSFNKRFLNSGARKYSGTFSDSFTAKPGDIVLATRQQSDNLPILGLPAILPIEFKDKKVVVGTNLYSVENHSEISNDFLFWLLKSPEYQRHILASAKGTTVKMITKDAVESFRFNCPPIEVRDFISQTLSDIEDKIELNNKINQELESLAQLLFNHWFVDFEFPNENGEPYKSSGGEMIDSELGEIPKGWEGTKFETLVKISTGKGINKKDYYQDGQYKVIGANGIMGHYNNFNTSGFKILTGRVGTLGTVRISTDNVWTSDNVLICEPLNSNLKHYAYFVMKAFDFSSLNRGSTQPLITQTDLKQQFVLLPKSETLILFQNQMDNFLSLIELNEVETQKLSNLRDTLLPKLISGELQINDN